MPRLSHLHIKAQDYIRSRASMNKLAQMYCQGNYRSDSLEQLPFEWNLPQSPTFTSQTPGGLS